MYCQKNRITINLRLQQPLFFSLLLCVLLLQGCAIKYSLTKGIVNIAEDSTQVSTPFYAGLNGYASFRIPSVVKTSKTILAFAEGRKNSSSDYGDIDVVCRRSIDGGKTWESLQIIHSNGDLVAQNPVPIYDELNDKVVLLFNTSALSEHAILNNDYDAADGRRAFVTSTTDEGLHWETPKEITKSVKRPYWRWFALGPVHGIQLQKGDNKGRLVVPLAISIAKGSAAYCMALIYSDDFGKSWKEGAVDEDITDAVRANETAIVNELNSVQGVAVDTKGYYYPSDEIVSNAMRPSATLNEILKSI